MNYLQTTIKDSFYLSGIGVHTGRAISARIEPAEANNGICFWREDVQGQNKKIPANVSNTARAMLCTRVENNEGIGINTIEHFMSAFFAMGIDNLNIYVDGPEMPILDGSAGPIIEALLKAGQTQQKFAARFLQILKEIKVTGENGAWARILPSTGLQICLDIDFPDPGIGRQKIDYSFSTSSYIETISTARTFCMLRDVQNMKHAGLAKGGTLENAVVVDNGRVLNKGGLRMEDECVRHKVLDCIGDLFLTCMDDKSSYIVKTNSKEVVPTRGFMNLPETAAISA